eukprot:c21029_g1_i1 orf=428-1708(-)
MGCLLSLIQDYWETNQCQGQEGAMFAFVPGMRIPTEVFFAKGLKGTDASEFTERISTLRNRIEMIVTRRCLSLPSPKEKTATHDGLTLSELHQALEEYFPVLLSLTKTGNHLIDAVEFAWTNQDDKEQETIIASTLYELLSMLHMMAILGLSEANMLLTPKAPADGYEPKITDESKLAAIETFLKLSGILECAKNTVMPQMPEEIKRMLPADLKEGVLCALSRQALGQVIEIQLGFAIDDLKATLAVKRRLSCEQVKCWKEAQESIKTARVESELGEKQALFINWKLAEAKAAAYYYHGLILDERSEENTHAKALVCIEAANGFLKESQRICTDFCTTPPRTSMPPLWGAMKYLTEKIPKDAVSKARIKRDFYYNEKSPEIVPDLPDFPLALQPEIYELPNTDALWRMDTVLRCQAMQVHNGQSSG